MTQPPPPRPPGPPPRPRKGLHPLLIAVIAVGGVFVFFVILGLIGLAIGSDDEDQADETTSRAAAPTSSATVAPSTSTAATAPSTSAPAAPAAAACYPSRPISDPELAAFAAGLALPPGVQVVTGRVSRDSDHPGKVGVALDLCVPDSTSADALRPIATTIAAELKPTDLGGRTFALYVADMSVDYKDEAKVKDPDYAVHLWNGKPSAAAELARWEVVAG